MFNKFFIIVSLFFNIAWGVSFENTISPITLNIQTDGGTAEITVLPHISIASLREQAEDAEAKLKGWHSYLIDIKTLRIVRAMQILPLDETKTLDFYLPQIEQAGNWLHLVERYSDESDSLEEAIINN